MNWRLGEFLIRKVIGMWEFPKISFILLGGPNKDCSILGSILVRVPLFSETTMFESAMDTLLHGNMHLSGIYSLIRPCGGCLSV